MTLYTYNLIDEPVLKKMKQSSRRIARWNNARYHLFNCIAHQKMGLFQHASIAKVPTEKHCDVSLDLLANSEEEKLFKLNVV